MKLILQAIKALFRKVENAIPEKLPNPNPITFTGAVEATYDGNQAVEVEIPKGGGGYDVVIKHFWHHGEYGNSEVILESGDFETLKNKFFNYECINALVYEIIFVNGETIQETLNTRMVVFIYDDNDDKIGMWADPNSNVKRYYIHPDNTAEYWVYED